MIVFRNQQHNEPVQGLITGIVSTAKKCLEGSNVDHETAVDLLIAFGELETGITDFVCRDADFSNDLTMQLRKTSLSAGRLFSCSWQNDRKGLSHWARDLLCNLDKLGNFDLPSVVNIRISEGYAYYGLYPETYLEAAEQFVRDFKPQNVLCIGLRSIGTSLSSVVWAALAQNNIDVQSVTIRPRCEPFERAPVVQDSFVNELLKNNPQFILIVDEGPGLSGSSLCGTVNIFMDKGIAPGRIIFFPSWIPDGSEFVNQPARRTWSLVKTKYVFSFQDTWIKPGRLFDAQYNCIRDISAGHWRHLLYDSPANYPPVHPHHEKRKYLCGDSEQFTQSASLYKFAGLGRYGRAKFDRALKLAQADFSPPVEQIYNGFLKYKFLPGTPLSENNFSTEFAKRAIDYFLFIKSNFPAPKAISFDYMCHMIENNVKKALGEEYESLGFLMKFKSACENAPAYELDGRLLPYEWISTASGVLKTDSVFHGNDHFFPGPADIAWDIASILLEYKLTRKQKIDFLNELSFKLHDDLSGRLDFYIIAYLAFRLGYTTFAYRQFGNSLDGEKFRLLAHRCSKLLKFHVNRLASH